MPLPMLGPRPPTHQPLDIDETMRLARVLDAALRDLEDPPARPAEIDDALLDRLAEELSVPRGHLLLAAAALPMPRFATTEELRFIACAGGCQAYGAGPVIEHLVELRRLRRAEGKPAFDIETRRCLDRCEWGPMLAVRLPDGQVGGLPRATPERVDEAVAQLFDQTDEDDASS